MGADDRAFLIAAAEITAALDEVPSRIVLLDHDGVIRWQNRASLAAGGPRNGFGFSAFVPPADVAAAQTAFEAVLEGGAPVEVSMRARDENAPSRVRRLSSWSALKLRDGTNVVIVVNLGDAPASGTPAERRAAGRPVLTRRQMEVLRLLDQGYSTAQIGRALTLSETTVRNHIANILTALGAHSRLQAVAVARTAGILAP